MNINAYVLKKEVVIRMYMPRIVVTLKGFQPAGNSPDRAEAQRRRKRDG